MNERERLLGWLYLITFGTLIAGFGFLIAGYLNLATTWPVFVIVMIAMGMFRYLGRKERKRRRAANG